MTSAPCASSASIPPVSAVPQTAVSMRTRCAGFAVQLETAQPEDRLVVLLSHHGLDTLTNTRTPHEGPAGSRLVGAAQLLELLHRFDNLVAWVNGHQHRNRVQPRPDPTGRTNGFWEITTSALMDWPCQARVIELADNGDGSLSVLCTMVDHDGIVQPDPSADWNGEWLAGMHRELAANEPWSGFGSGREGYPTDRNVDLRLPAPFDLRRVSEGSANQHLQSSPFPHR